LNFNKKITNIADRYKILKSTTMKHKVILGVLLVLSTTSQTGYAQKKSKKQPVIVKLGQKQVSVSEFQYVYDKNNANAEDANTQQSINEYLELYINFKLKVMEAEDMGLDTTAKFREELEGYKKQLAKPYLTEKVFAEKLIKEAYERLKEEVKCSHILISVDMNAEPDDTLTAFNKIVEIRKKAVNGEDFGALAQQFSQDPSAKSNKGELPYFTALQMVYSFENAAYFTKVNEISKPFRTRFGYHIVKVLKRRPSRGEIKTAHIMVKTSAGVSKEDAEAAKQKIDDIYNRLKQGKEWGKLCAQFSEDASSASKGGELPWFSTGKMNLPTFEDAAFTLNSSGDISEPVLTPYGWHIIKLIDKKALGSFEDLQPMLKSKVTQDSRSELSRIALIKKLKKENNFVEYPKVLEKALLQADPSLIQALWSFDGNNKVNKTTLFKINKQKYTINDLFSYIYKKQKRSKNISPTHYMRLLYKNFTEESIMNYEEAHLGEKYSEYNLLLKEYRDGILLFQLMDQKVWSRAITDTTGQKELYEKNRENFFWDTRLFGTIYDCADPDILNKLKQVLKKQKSVTGLAESINKNTPGGLKITYGPFQKGENDLTDSIEWKVGSYTLMENGRWKMEDGKKKNEHGFDPAVRINYIVVSSIEDPMPKTLQEARGLVISDLQYHLEKQWNKSLREKYSVVVNEEEVQKLIK